MGESIVTGLFLVLAAALIGGFLARLVKLPPLVGVILAGIIGSTFLPVHSESIVSLSEIGLVLLLFSVGLETSFTKLARVGSVATIGQVIQMLLITVISFAFLHFLLGISTLGSIFLSSGFALSSTALVVKMLNDAGELSTLHGEILIGGCLIQDLAVVPLVVILPAISGAGGDWASASLKSLLIVGVILSVVLIIGKLFAPYITSFVADIDSRELLILGSVVVALGIASIVSVFGVSAAIGAFLAGLVISGTQESHAIFAETRPLRDLFSILFFVTLGFLVVPSFLIANIGIILLLSAFVILLKLVTGFLISVVFGYRGKTAISFAIGISQVGEFAFVLYLIGKTLHVLTDREVSIGIATAVVTLVVSPIFFRLKTKIWRKLKRVPLFSGGVVNIGKEISYTNHVVICGYGRMGHWVGKTLEDLNIPYVVIDYSQKVVHEARKNGVNAIYGDPGEKEVLEAAGIKNAKALIVSLPDRIAQNEIISYCQTVVPSLKIIARAHLDEDVKKLIQLKVEKVVQPEFEGALAMIREILRASGKTSEEIATSIKGIRLSHSRAT
ncbi:MAG TPA: cation:proton antiporter [Patescibacteria group bacterium]